MTDTAIILSELRQLRTEVKKIREDNARMRQELFKSNNKETWVGSIDIMKLTGWDKYELKRHRDQNTIQFKFLSKSDNGGRSAIRYNINSIPDHYLNKQ